MIYICRPFIRLKITNWRWIAGAKRLLSRLSIVFGRGEKALRKMPSTGLAGRRIPSITIVSRITSKTLNGSMRNVLSGLMGFIVLMCGPSSTAIWTVGFCVTVSPRSDVGSAVMNIFWPFLASADISALPATKSASWNSGSGYRVFPSVIDNL